MKINDLPKKISVFPLDNFIIFPKTTVPLNIFEPRYIEMINDSMRTNKLVGMIQPKSSSNDKSLPNLHNIGCLGKITTFKEAEDGRYLIELKGLVRFEVIKEINSHNKYREYEVDYKKFYHDLSEKKEELKFSDLELIFKDLKSLFKKRINALAMASPFSLEEKQVLLEAENLNIRKNKIAEILSTYTYDVFDNTTLQ